MNFAAYFERYLRVIEVVGVILALVVAAQWWYSHNMTEQKVGYDRAVSEYTAKDAEKLRAALAETAHYKQLYEEAQSHANDREKVNAAAANAAATVAVGLQRTLETIASGVPGATAEALRKTTLTLTTVLGECKARYVELGQKADGHVNDVQTLIESWPASLTMSGSISPPKSK